MIKPLTFEEYWNTIQSRLAFTICSDIKVITKNTWDIATRQAELICINLEEENEGVAILDKDIFMDIAAEISALKSEQND